MTSHTTNRNGGMLVTRNELSMPKWVTEQSDRIGPRPPPPPLATENDKAPPKQPSLPPKTKQPEPDYEVIEFSNQQYSNTPVRPNSASSGSKTPDTKLKCTLCGSGNPWVTCDECAQQIFCASCDDMFHKHPKRKSHQRKTIETSRPPLPPKVVPGQSGPTPPVAPPRRSKRGIMTPIMQRKDQGNAMRGPFPEAISPTPSSNNSPWQDRLGSLPRGLNLLNRPLPETPKTASESSRSTTPKSVFDNIQRPPSVALEKIKSKANATLDRMQFLQLRYRQQKERMERERSGSVTEQRQMALQHQQMGVQRTNQLGQRGMSNSVFNLNQVNPNQPTIANKGWMINNPMQQAQSMAQLNCGNCAQQQQMQWNGFNQHHMHKYQDPWSNKLSSQQHLNRSNMSLNMPAGYMMPPQMNNLYPPPAFMNQMYPQPYMAGMPVMNPGLICMPPSTSRAASRAGSRIPSPAMSRKSVTLRRKQRSSYIDDEPTDDEDSDEDDRRSITSMRSGVMRSRQRRLSSASQFQLDDDYKTTQNKVHRNRARNQRRDSITNSISNDWSPGRRTSSINNNRSADSGFNSPRKTSRIYSDLDSEGSGTRALVQAKIEQKLKEESLRQKQTKSKRRTKSPPPEKTSAAVQTPAVKQSNKKENGNDFVDVSREQENKLLQIELEQQHRHKKEIESLKVMEIPKSAADEYEEDEKEYEKGKESDSKEVIEQAIVNDENEIEEDNLGPPPSTPDHEWECEFCTFVNEANIKICSICCKTPSIKPKKVMKQISPPKQIEVSSNKNGIQDRRKEDNKPVKHKSGTIKKTSLTSSKPLSAQTNPPNNSNNPEKSSNVNKNVRTSKTNSASGRTESTTNVFKNKGSVEDIWASLDENIQATASEVTRKAQTKEPSLADSSSKSASAESRENKSEQPKPREMGTSPPPQSISTQTYNTLPIRKRDLSEESVTKPAPQTNQNDIKQESDLFKYTAEELNAALKYCGPEVHPLVWLRDNWPKLIQTVQSLATKYGQERAENTIGTISLTEARESLRMHTGNIWQAVSECIEQRQQKYREISAKGNFSREDIVTALTTHQGNVELALNDLGRTQLKPFLMRIWGSPGGVENESGSQPATQSVTQINNMDQDIHIFLSANASECMQTPNATGAYLVTNQTPSPFERPASLNSPSNCDNHVPDKISSYRTETKHFPNSPLQLDESILSNKNILKDLETLIGNMEHDQQKQNNHLLRSIHDMVANVNNKTGNEYDSDSMRILTKSPIVTLKLKTTCKESNAENEVDVKNFVRQHIQDIMPNLVQQVEMQLVEDIDEELNSNEPIKETREIAPNAKRNIPAPPPPPIDQDEFLMEEVIKPNIKIASIREELPPQYVYTAEIATFQFAFDKGLEKEHEDEFEFETLKEASRRVYKMFKLPEIQEFKPIGQNRVESIMLETAVSKSLQSHNENLSNSREINLKEAEIQSVAPSENQADLLLNDGQVLLLKNNIQGIFVPIEDAINENGEISNQKPSKNQTEDINTNVRDISRELDFSKTDIEPKDSDTSKFSKSLGDVTGLTIPSSNISQTLELENNAKLSSLSNTKSFESSNDNTAKRDFASSSNYNEVTLTLPNKSEQISTIENETMINEAAAYAINKKTSKIPIRRTTSSKNLIRSSTNLTKLDPVGPTNSFQSNSIATTTITETPQPISNVNHTNNTLTDKESEEKAFYGINNNTFDAEGALKEDPFQSPSTSSEMFLVIQQEGSENASTIVPSSSTSTLQSTTSQASGFKSPTEFVPSGDPSKQNLTELVEDTQRLIKQMKDEISIDDFESSTDDADYSEEFSDEYDDEENEEEEDWEEDDWEEGEYQHDDMTEDITEENEVFSIEEDSIRKTQSPSLSQESQDNRAMHNSSALSNKTESSNHSFSFLFGHFEQEDPIIIRNNDLQIQNNANDETSAYVETENSLPELPAEMVTGNSSQNTELLIQYERETENIIPEMSVETILSHTIAQDPSNTPQDFKELSTSSRDIILVPVEPAATEMSSENSNNNLDSTENEYFRDIEDPQESTTVSNNFVGETVNVDKELNIQETFAKAADDLSPNIEEKLTSATSAEQLQSEAGNVSASQEENTATTQREFTGNQDESTPVFIANQTSSAASSQNPLLEPSNQPLLDAEATEDKVTSTGKAVKTSQDKNKSSVEQKFPLKKSSTTSKIPKPKQIVKETKQTETPVTKPKNDLKKKSYIRSKSFSGPPTPIGITSVKTISQKFISPSPNAQLTTPKKHTTVTRKSSIVETINKLTTPPTSPDKPALSSIFKSRTQHRIPKKKYHETCFSDDDYESSTDEQLTEPLEVRQRKLSVPVFKAYPSIQEPEEVNTDELVERFIKQELAATVAEAQIAAALVAMKFQQDVSLWAAKQCSDLDHAIALLKQECELCNGTFALNQIVSMLKCTHKCCKQCAKTYFTVQITERSINDCSCPFCKLPELHNQTEHEDENLEYFSNLDIFLKNILEPEVHELFQRKLRDRTLLKDPNFKWCVQCSSGFFARPKQKRLICPDCGSVTCAQCRKTWQKQHEGISCDQFSEWQSANDPEVQAKGVQQHLERNGIDCPKCKFRYSLARGGCMHFTCTQCKYEFCYGCAKPFMMGAKCTVSSYCARLGLHAHHPRNCLFYLRDKLPVQLQILLKNNYVSFEVDPLEVSENGDDNEPSSSKRKELLCSIPIQKETPTGLVDTRCNGDVPEKHAGMCRNHYVEYLTAKVAKAKIDPLPIFDLTDCVQELRRRGIALPERGPWDTDEIYKNMCAQVIQKNIPLDID